MNLKQKLMRLSSVGTAPPPSDDPAVAPASASTGDERAARLTELRRRLSDLENGNRRRERHARRRPAWSHAGGTPPTVQEDTPEGPLHLRRQRLPLEHRHGDAKLAACAGLEAGLLAKLALDEGLATLSPERLLFFDTETTGLAGGAGTLPFLVGLAYFEAGELCIEQLLLPEPGREGPILGYLESRLAWASGLVTFNGKSFDWPLVSGRFVMNRRPAPPVLPHVDLLHCARRVFKFRLQEMRLQHLEREVLGFERQGDIPGAEIPASYFAFLRGAPESSLSPVFEHNAHDLVALAALLGYVAERFNAADFAGEDARDRLGLAHVAARAGDHARAVSFATAAAELDRSGKTGAQALTLAGDVLRRQGEPARAVEQWRAALLEVSPGSWLASELALRLAKAYEHDLKDAAQALPFARQTALVEGQEAAGRRLLRLEKKVSRRSARRPE